MIQSSQRQFSSYDSYTNPVQIVKAGLASFSRIDALISNAGICPFHTFLDLPAPLWKKVQDVNLNGAFYVTQAVANQMAKQDIVKGREGTWASGRGSIVAVSSISALMGGGEQCHYTPTKAGVKSLMESCAIALGPYGIRCNSVLPGESTWRGCHHFRLSGSRRCILDHPVLVLVLIPRHHRDQYQQRRPLQRRQARRSRTPGTSRTTGPARRPRGPGAVPRFGRGGVREWSESVSGRRDGDQLAVGVRCDLRAVSGKALLRCASRAIGTQGIRRARAKRTKLE